MAGIFVGNGEQIALENLTNKVAPQNLIIHLFQNNHTPAYSDTVSSYTEATFTGYAAVTLSTAANWTVSGSDPASIAYTQVSFTSSATQTAQTIYGYYVTRATSADLVFAEAFSSPATIQNNGDQINITPTINAT